MNSILNASSYNLMINFSVIYLIVVTLIAQHFTPKDYNWPKRTLSDLAIRGYSKAWIMRLGFIIFGLLIFIAVLSKINQSEIFIFADALVMTYAIFIFLTGAFSTWPVGEVHKTHEKIEDKLHSAFAWTGGFTLGIAILAYTFSTTGTVRAIHFLVLLLILVISSIFTLAKNKKVQIDHGMTQRLLCLAGLLWIVLNYNFLQ